MKSETLKNEAEARKISKMELEAIRKEELEKAEREEFLRLSQKYS